MDEGKTVLWQVNGVQNDALHKIGAGTLYIQGTGINPGSLNVGDGQVILDQQPDSQGKIQAFSEVTLLSGRPTLQLNSADQVDPEHIQFGYRAEPWILMAMISLSAKLGIMIMARVL